MDMLLGSRMVHKCSKCSYVTRSLFSLKTHISSHLVPKSWRLFNCTKNTPEPYMCQKCNYITYLTVEFNNHCKSHKCETIKCEKRKINYNQWFQCDRCSFKTMSRQSLTSHINQNIHSITLHLCRLCKFQSTNICHLRSHLVKQHTVIKDTKVDCRECEYRFEESDILIHMLEAHTLIENVQENHSKMKEKPLQWYECDSCPFKTFSKGSFYGHMSVHNNVKYDCPHCSFETKMKRYLARHINIKHPDELSHTEDPSIEHTVISRSDVFKCEKCSYRTHKRAQLNAHVQHMHDIQWFMCDFCEHKTKSRCNLKQHVLLTHKRDEIKWLQCDKCEYKAMYKHRLRNHAWRHF